MDRSTQLNNFRVDQFIDHWKTTKGTGLLSREDMYDFKDQYICLDSQID